jgi:hypothetical protein
VLPGAIWKKLSLPCECNSRSSSNILNTASSKQTDRQSEPSLSDTQLRCIACYCAMQAELVCFRAVSCCLHAL